METVQGPGNSTIEVKPSTLLLVDDEENILAALRRALRKDGYHILCAPGGEEGLALLSHESVDVIISDQRMPRMLGTQFLREAQVLSPHSVRIILSGYTDLESVTAAINEGAVYKFLTKPWDDEILRLYIREALRQKWMQDENRMLHSMLVNLNEELTQSNERLIAKAKASSHALQGLQASLDALPVGLLSIDADMCLRMTNHMACALLPALQIGKPAGLMLPEEMAPLLTENKGLAMPYQCSLILAGKNCLTLMQQYPNAEDGRVIIIFPAVQI